MLNLNLILWQIDNVAKEATFFIATRLQFRWLITIFLGVIFLIVLFADDGEPIVGFDTIYQIWSIKPSYMAFSFALGALVSSLPLRFVRSDYIRTGIYSLPTLLVLFYSLTLAWGYSLGMTNVSGILVSFVMGMVSIMIIFLLSTQVTLIHKLKQIEAIQQQSHDTMAETMAIKEALQKVKTATSCQVLRDIMERDAGAGIQPLFVVYEQMKKQNKGGINA